ncbi:MAG: FAD-dependent oxidoreductase [Gemmatimonadaceae bacterium]
MFAYATSTPTARQMVADVTVVGTGIIALTSAIELADRGLSVRLVGTMHSGNASSAAGGMLAPSVGRKSGSVQAFAEASRDSYPDFVTELSERSGRHIPLNVDGIFEVALTESDFGMLERSFESPSRWVSPAELASEEPALTPGFGAVYHPLDGCVEPLRLLDALSVVVAGHNSITTVREDCRELHATELGCNILTAMESRFASDYVVLAAGAWTPLIAGSGQIAENVKPVRGQMIALEGAPIRHVTCGAGGYLIPRSDGVTVVGGTMENAGFEAVTTPAGLEMIQSRAAALCPALDSAAAHSSWAGLRPVTPDLLPIIGADPARPRVIYACGHSRNGILLAPLTAEAIGDIVCGTAPRHDLSRFRPGRH